jgi:2-polyprenyl-3-methyl-5-hydroxy-6-metoxy-1,4-benzoquinol methylase
MEQLLTKASTINLIDPKTGQPLHESKEGLVDESGKIVYPLINGAYRVAEMDNYTSNFGLEWNTFQKTQIDKFSGSDVSRVRFFSQTKWADDLRGQNILEVGSGAGRFSQIVLDHTNATLYSVDYSSAVEANYKNNGPHERFKLFQASIYELPFAKASFDKVLCLGVLQHTPDFKKSVQSLAEMVRPGGQLVVDFYPVNGWYTKINAKYLLRPFTKNMSHGRLMRLIRKHAGWMIRLFEFNKKIGLGFLNRFIPVCGMDHKELGLTDEQFKEWVVLDTFDMFSPQYDDPQRLNTVAQWFAEFGMKNVEAEMVEYKKGFIAATVRGTK